MTGKWRNLHNFGGAVSDCGPRGLDILQVLAAAGIGAEGRGGERDGPPDAIVTHLPDGVRQQGVPVPVSPVNRELHHLPQGGYQFPVLVVNRAPAIKMVVMGRHRQQALPGDVASP